MRNLSNILPENLNEQAYISCRMSSSSSRATSIMVRIAWCPRMSSARTRELTGRRWATRAPPWQTMLIQYSSVFNVGYRIMFEFISSLRYLARISQYCCFIFLSTVLHLLCTIRQGKYVADSLTFSAMFPCYPYWASNSKGSLAGLIGPARYLLLAR